MGSRRRLGSRRKSLLDEGLKISFPWRRCPPIRLSVLDLTREEEGADDGWGRDTDRDPRPEQRLLVAGGSCEWASEGEASRSQAVEDLEITAGHPESPLLPTRPPLIPDTTVPEGCCHPGLSSPCQGVRISQANKASYPDPDNALSKQPSVCLVLGFSRFLIVFFPTVLVPFDKSQVRSSEL